MADGGSNSHLIELSDAALADVPETIARPRYDRSALTPGIVHIGLGNFHRAHQAWYLHRLMQAGRAHDWAILGAGVRPADAAQRSRLRAQDHLTTLIELDPARISAEITGSMIGFVPVEPDNAALIAQMADPAIRIVSLTVTEGAYFVDPATGGFDASHDDIRHDAANPGAPRTAFGAMIAALRIRRARGIPAFTAMSCDNLLGNGDVLRQTITSLAALSDPDLAAWIEAHCAFPNSMVDCIVPATGPNEMELARSLGIADKAPVSHEAFRQWVIEDHFSCGRPPWEEAGATISDRVEDYETMKIRILNGGHQIIAGIGDLLGIETIAETMASPSIRALLHKVATEEIAPHVLATPAMTPSEYVSLIENRFANPRIADTTRRVAFDGSSRHPGFLAPSIRDGLRAGTPTEGLALVSAIWSRYCEGTRPDGSVIEPNDPYWDELQRQALASRNRPETWLRMRRIYGDLSDNGRFASAFVKWRHQITAEGPEAALGTYLRG